MPLLDVWFGLVLEWIFERISHVFESTVAGMKSFRGVLTQWFLWVAAVFLMYVVWYNWDMHKLRAFCSAAKPGLSLAALPEISDKYGISRRWLAHQGAFDQETGLWSLYVPSTASVGANVCAIHHNKLVVVSAVIEID